MLALHFKYHPMAELVHVSTRSSILVSRLLPVETRIEESGILRVCVRAAEHLQRVSGCFSQNPYVRFTAGTKVVKTQVCPKGGENPKFNPIERFDILLDSDTLELVVEVFDHWTLQHDRLIGSFRSTIKSITEEFLGEHVVQLQPPENSRVRDAGKITLEVIYIHPVRLKVSLVEFQHDPPCCCFSQRLHLFLTWSEKTYEAPTRKTLLKEHHAGSGKWVAEDPVFFSNFVNNDDEKRAPSLAIQIVDVGRCSDAIVGKGVADWTTIRRDSIARTPSTFELALTNGKKGRIHVDFEAFDPAK